MLSDDGYDALFGNTSGEVGQGADPVGQGGPPGR